MDAQLTASGHTYQVISKAVKIIVFAVVVITAFVLARIVFLFFEQLKTIPGYQFVIDFSESFMGPFKGIGTVNTPFKGVFDIGATVLLMLLIVAEFMLNSIAGFFRRLAGRQVIKEKPEAPQVQVIVSPNISNVAAPEPAPDFVPSTTEPPATTTAAEPKEPEKVEAEK